MLAETAMDPQVIVDAVRGATENVFSTMMDLGIEALEPIDHSQPEAVNGVVALLGFTGSWTGTGMFYCSDHFACRVGSALLMTEVEEVNGEVLDGIGELANMILGNFKESIEAQTGPLALTVPTVVYGKNFQTRTPVLASWTIVPFKVEDATFEVRVCIQPTE